MRIRGAIFDVDGTLLDSMFIWDSMVFSTPVMKFRS